MRLINADELSEYKFIRESTKGSDYMRGWNDAIDAIIDNAPTIVPEVIQPLISNLIEIMPGVINVIIENIPVIIRECYKDGDNND